MDKGYVWPSKYSVEDMSRDDVFAKVNTSTIRTEEESMMQLYTRSSLLEMCRQRVREQGEGSRSHSLRGYSHMNKRELMVLLGLLA